MPRLRFVDAVCWQDETAAGRAMANRMLTDQQQLRQTAAGRLVIRGAARGLLGRTTMVRTPALLMAGLMLLAATSCVSRGQYRELQQSMAAEQDRSLKVQQSLEERIDVLTSDIVQLQETNENLERRHENVLEINNQLHEEVLQLEYRLKKSETIIQTQEKVIEDFSQARKKIEADLRDQIAAKDVMIEEMEGKLKVTFVDKILFSTGSDQINQPGRAALLKIAESLRDGAFKQIVVEGHTDDVPIGPALANRFPSNWELSAARAIAVVRFLEEKAGLDPTRLAANAYSFHRPLASNEKESGRSKNRRIEIILAPLTP